MKTYYFNGQKLKEARETLCSHFGEFIDILNAKRIREGKAKISESTWHKWEYEKRAVLNPQYVAGLLNEFCEAKIDLLKSGFTSKPIEITEVSREGMHNYKI